jgi:hypothetical protein
MQQPNPAPQPEGKSAPIHLGPAPTGLDPAPVTNELNNPVAVRIDDEWRRWIAENLTLDLPRENIIAAMVAAGIRLEEAIRELDLAAVSPYLKGASLLRNRLKKRDWLLSNYRKLNRLHRASGFIERRHKLSRAEFLDQYYSTNRAVILTGMMDDWPALRKWNLDYFAETFGDRAIEVQFGRTAGENYEIECEKYTRTVRMADFVAMVRHTENTNDFYLTANNNSRNKSVLPELWEDIVQVPEYLDNQSQGRLSGFFWMGPAGTITPFHHDLTNNFMAQVIGRKRVKLAPSWDVPLMSNHIHCFSKCDGRLMPPTPDAAFDEPQIHECVLERGEILFLPVGCMHFVEGIDISVTVSFTNFVFDNDFSSFYTTYQAV